MTLAIVRPRQAPSDDPRIEHWLQRAKNDASFLHGVLAIENAKECDALEKIQTVLETLETQRQQAHEQMDAISRHVALRQNTMQLLEQWRRLRFLARMGGQSKERVGI